VTDHLVTFLRARLDEDEQIVQRSYYSDTYWELFTTTARLGAWRAWRGYFPRELWDAKATDAIADATRDAIRDRITAHEADRAERALAEVDAKREMLREADSFCAEYYADMDDDNSNYQRAECWRQTNARLLALPYADHPDYRDEWRPTTCHTQAPLDIPPAPKP
jgi:hypothetical protein